MWQDEDSQLGGYWPLAGGSPTHPAPRPAGGYSPEASARLGTHMAQGPLRPRFQGRCAQAEATWSQSSGGHQPGYLGTRSAACQCPPLTTPATPGRPRAPPRPILSRSNALWSPTPMPTSAPPDPPGPHFRRPRPAPPDPPAPPSSILAQRAAAHAPTGARPRALPLPARPPLSRPSPAPLPPSRPARPPLTREVVQTRRVHDLGPKLHGRTRARAGRPWR